MTEKLSGKIVLISGGGRGIGRATAEAFAAQGAKVVITSRTAKELNATAKAIKAQGGDVLAVVADVASKTSVAKLMRAATQKFGAIEVLVNNAAILEPVEPLWKAPHKAFLQNLRVNIDGVFLCAQAVLPAMMARKSGVIINISSGAARGNHYGWGAYSATKAAVDSLTRTMANELKDYHIAVNALYPGIAETAMQQKIRATEEEQMGGGAQWFRERFERGENAPPEYPAKFIVWLAQQTELTGQALDINDPAVKARAGV